MIIFKGSKTAIILNDYMNTDKFYYKNGVTFLKFGLKHPAHKNQEGQDEEQFEP